MSDTQPVVCPECVDEAIGVHLGPVYVETNNHAVRVTGDCEVEFLPAPDERRGTHVSQLFWCESGHAWTLTHWFHKGVVTREVTMLTDASTVTPRHYDELWRD